MGGIEDSQAISSLEFVLPEGNPKSDSLQKLSEELRGFGGATIDGSGDSTGVLRSALGKALDRGQVVEVQRVRSMTYLAEGVNARPVNTSDLTRIAEVLPIDEQVQLLGRKVQPGDWIASLFKPVDRLLEDGKIAPTLKVFSPEDAARELIRVPGHPGDLVLVRPTASFVADTALEHVANDGRQIIHPKGTVVSIPINREGKPELHLASFDSPAKFRSLLDSQLVIVEREKSQPLLAAVSEGAALAEVQARERLLAKIEEQKVLEPDNSLKVARKALLAESAAFVIGTAREPSSLELVQWLQTRADATGLSTVEVAALGLRSPELIGEAFGIEAKNSPSAGQRVIHMVMMMPESMSTRSAWVQVFVDPSGDTLVNPVHEKGTGPLISAADQGVSEVAITASKQTDPVGRTASLREQKPDLPRRIWKGGGGRTSAIAALTALGFSPLELDEP